jgi:hypothetical protein
MLTTLGADQGKSGERERCGQKVQLVRYRIPGLLLVGFVSACTHAGRTHLNDASPSGAIPARKETLNSADVATPAHIKRPRAALPNAPVATTSHPQIDELIGLDESGIRTALGDPTSREDHAPTKRWVYRLKQCTMNVTFYPEVETRQFHALNYEVNSDDGSAKRQQSCVAEFSSRLPTKSAAK